MKHTAISVLTITIILTIAAVTGGCGDSTGDNGLPVETSSPTLPTEPVNTGQPAPADAWKPDGVLGDNEYLSEIRYGNFEIRWLKDDRSIYFGIKADNEGWLSIGLEPSSQMKDADMIFGMVKDGEAVISDQFSTGAFGPHAPDTELGGSNDIIEFGGREEGGFTIIEFSRALETGDNYDNGLTAGKTKIIWAYGSSDDFSTQHTSRGSGEIDL